VSALAQAAGAAARELELQFARAEQRDIELTEAERWARDPVGWINEHVWIASVFGSDGIRARVRQVRMRLFPGQVQTITAWVDRDHLAETGELRFRNIDAEKSRQIGETWLFAAVICWVLHYHRGSVGGCLHRVGAEIDDGGERNTIKSEPVREGPLHRPSARPLQAARPRRPPLLACLEPGPGEDREPRERRRRLRGGSERRPVPRHDLGLLLR